MDCGQSYEVFNSKFMLKLMTSYKFPEIMAKMGPEHTEEERFSYIWSLDEAHAFLTPTLISCSKSNNASYEYCRQGDIARKLPNFDKALKLYNLAILSAPHPALITGKSFFDNDVEENAKKHGKEVYGRLAQAYESRSVLLFDMEQYEKCSEDIDRTLELGCLQASKKNRLLKMKERCQKVISSGKVKAKSASAMALNAFECSFAYVNPKPPKLSECNPAVPSWSSALKLVYTHTQGRDLIADRDIIPGEILIVDEGYCSTIHQNMLKICCIECTDRCLAPLPCPACNTVIFCSEACRTQGYHWEECPVLPTLYELGEKESLYFLYRLMVKTSHAKIKEMIPLLQQETKDQPPETLGFNKDGIYDLSDYRSVYHLVTNSEKVDLRKRLDFTIKAFIVTKLLEQSGRYFLDDCGKPFTPSHDDIILTGSTLIHHIMSIACNGKGIYYWKECVKDKIESQLEPSGLGVYSSNLMNHSCNPNCYVHFYGKTEVMRATHFIPAGVSLTYSYSDQLVNFDRDLRRASLMKAFYFTCTCEACENDWPSVLYYPGQQIILKCLKCNNAINPITRLCSQCKLDYNKQKGVKGMSGQDLPPYNYTHILRKVEKHLYKFLIVKEKLLAGVSDEDVKLVRIMIKIFCIYVHQPNINLHIAVRAFRCICNKFGSQVYVKNHTQISPEFPIC